MIVGSNNGSSSGTATSNTVTVSGYSVAVGDGLILVTHANAGGTLSFGDPSGFTPGDSLSSALPTVQLGSGGPYWRIAVKIAAAGDVGTPSYVTIASSSSHWCQALIVVRGRIASSVNAMFPNNAATATGGVSTGTSTYDLNGVTALAGDDVICGSTVGLNGSISAAITSSLSGYATQQVAQQSGSGFLANVQTFGNSNVAAGSTGTLPVSLTVPGGVNYNAFGGFVMSIPAASAPSGNKGGFFFGSLAPVVPLAWAIERRRRRARERFEKARRAASPALRN